MQLCISGILNLHLNERIHQGQRNWHKSQSSRKKKRVLRGWACYGRFKMATLKHPSQASQPTALCLEVCATHRDQTVQFLLQILSERLWLRIYPDIFCWWWHHLDARASLCPEWSATIATSHPGMPSISKLGGQCRNILSWGFLASAGWVFLFPHETCLLLSGSLGPPNLETRRFGFTKVASGFAFYGLPNPSCSVPVSAVLFRWSWQTSLVLRNFTSLPAGRVNNHTHWRTGNPDQGG